MTEVYQLRAADLDSRPSAVVRACLPAAQIASWLPGALRRVRHELARQHVEPVGPPFVRYTPEEDGIGVDAGYLVSEPIEDNGDVVASGLPGGPAVIAIHVERPAETVDAWQALDDWLWSRGFRAAGPLWEYWTDGPEEGSGRGTVDVFLPYRWR
ncbi:GyrI-like domain-containing protein [Dactylosporangium fulvum]|uniref:GyrI-like domain-containing protein n=1 Tax=Dactylosporangium fulvum TaxID=53359 RepID=A0ABY5VPR3_9ACTN|nr:GyrI-like domain-containing protein [Dactylosporangium fulvum]UWP79041.1 GyrI-like domain-containing protein [Dactylosporangium fulvum]